MAPISLRDPKFEELAEEFVKIFTGFKKGSKNFHLSVQYTLSNFRYHHFLDVDSNKVERAINGICQKIEVHSQEVEAKTLRRLCERFLVSPLSDFTESPKSDTHYSLLLLLLNLSGSPTNVDYRPKLLEQDPEKDEFDWRAYLLDDAEDEVIGIPSANQDVWDWSEEEEEGSELDRTSDSGISVGQQQFHGHRVDNRRAHSDEAITAVDSDGCLSDTVVRQYWSDTLPSVSHQDSCESGHFSIADSWDDYQRNRQPFYQFEHRNTLTETQVVRETLWMLSGVQDSFVYTFQDDGIDVRQNIQVSHLTPGSLFSCLRRFASVGEQIQALQCFVSSVLLSRDGSVVITQTYQALAEALSSYFKGYKAELSSMEKKILGQETPTTLLVLQENLQPRIEEVTVLYTVFKTGVLEAVHLNSAEKTTRLLNVLHGQILQADRFGSLARWKVSLLLQVFLQTVQPCMNFIDKWVTSGLLADPADEFFIERDESINTENTSFWETGAAVKKVQGQPTGTSDDGVVPNFLHDLVHQVICAGKSMGLISGLGKMTDLQFTSNKGTLFNDFIDQLHCETRQVSETDGAEIQTNASVFRVAERSSVMSVVNAVWDPMLKFSFMASTPVNSTMSSQNFPRRRGSSEDKLKGICSGIASVLKPLELIFRKCLTSLIEERYTRSCRNLFHLLNSDYNLLDHLAAMRNFFLLEAGETMHQFYVGIFLKIRRKEPWQDISYLNSSLQESLQARFPQFIERLSVSVSSTPAVRQQLLHSLQGLSMNYKVPWPVSIVIDSSCQKKYNEVFLFLMKVKRAKWSLDDLRFTDLRTGRNYNSDTSSDEGETQQDTHAPARQAAEQNDSRLMQKMFVLRFKLMHFMNNLHTYIMTRILHTTVLEFQRSLEKAKDLDDLIKVHHSYVDKVCDRCLLSQKVGFIKEAILKVLNIALVFQARWDSGVQNISVEVFEKLEAKFSKCKHFIITFLDNIVKRGAFPHLEALAFMLSANLPDVEAVT